MVCLDKHIGYPTPEYIHMMAISIFHMRNRYRTVRTVHTVHYDCAVPEYDGMIALCHQVEILSVLAHLLFRGDITKHSPEAVFLITQNLAWVG